QHGLNEASRRLPQHASGGRQLPAAMSQAADGPFQIHTIAAPAAAKASHGGAALAEDLLDETVHVRRQSHSAVAAPLPVGHAGGGSQPVPPVPAGHAAQQPAVAGSAPAVAAGAPATAKATAAPAEAPKTAPSVPPKAAPPSPSFASRFPGIFGFGQRAGRPEAHKKEAHAAEAGAAEAKAAVDVQQILQEVQTPKARATASSLPRAPPAAAPAAVSAAAP
ncbi:unnamed protein product, partial [Prorocentrum cordatum]